VCGHPYSTATADDHGGTHSRTVEIAEHILVQHYGFDVTAHADSIHKGLGIHCIAGWSIWQLRVTQDFPIVIADQEHRLRKRVDVVAVIVADADVLYLLGLDVYLRQQFDEAGLRRHGGRRSCQNRYPIPRNRRHT
jgi:hypothetical protein